MSEIVWRKSTYSADQGGCVEVGQAWRKSSYSASQGGCIEVAQPWLKSSHSAGQGGCVEVAKAPADVHVRDTKDRASGSLTFGQASWRTFLAAVGTA
jgi:hypothetical protein